MKSKMTLGLLILLTATGWLYGQQTKLGQDLNGIDPNSNVDVIVQFQHPPTEAHHQMVRNHGGALKGQFQSVMGAVYKVPANGLEGLSHEPEVAYISPDRPLGAKLDLTAAAVNAIIARQSFGVDGTGITVAVIDSGISDDQDLHAAAPTQQLLQQMEQRLQQQEQLPGGPGPGRIIYQQNFVSGSGPNDASDYYGHGEHVAGIIGGNGSNSMCPQCTRHFIGIAPNVNLIDFRVLDQNGSGTDSGVIAAIDQAIAMQSEYNIRVINLSLGRPVYESYTQDPLCQAVEAAWRAGIVVVVSAGNDGRDNSVGEMGYATITAPGNDPHVITVGAMETNGTPQRNDDTIASYSSKGPTMIDHFVKPDLVAPGNLVVSLEVGGTTIPQLYPTTQIPLSYFISQGGSALSNQYIQLSGTSMAAGVVSGAAALLLQAHPSLTPDQVKARLMLTAYKTFPPSSQAIDPATGIVYTSYYDIFTVGAGYLDIQAALANSDLATRTALSPTVVQDPNTDRVTLVDDPAGVWGSSGVWSNAVIWGTSALLNGTTTVWDPAALWSTPAVWATSTTEGPTAVFAEAAVWGTRQ